MEQALTIGFLARAANVNIETVRYYQRIGLIQEPLKPPTGYRVYPTETIKRIKFIKSAQPLGFSLQEIAELLDLGSGHCADVRLRAEQKRAHIEQQIIELKNLRTTLDTLIHSCQADTNNIHCPIIESLAGDNEKYKV